MNHLRKINKTYFSMFGYKLATFTTRVVKIKK